MDKNKENTNQIGTKDRREQLGALKPGSERELLSPLPPLNIVPSNSRRSSSVKFYINSASPVTHSSLSHGDESMTVMLSVFYAKLLIVLGMALTVTSTIENKSSATIATGIFYIYTYVVSSIFLPYTFYQLRMARKEQKKNEQTQRVRYGGFYLHIGIAGFSMGSIIYSLLQIGVYFDYDSDCRRPLEFAKQVLQIIFMVIQTVFTFACSDVLETMRGNFLDRLGLMHLIATNVCEWLNVIVQDSKEGFIKSVAYKNATQVQDYHKIYPSTVLSNLTAYLEPPSPLSLEENWMCNLTDIITPLIERTKPYLRPCGVEYSLLCSIIIAVIWNDVCTVPGLKKRHKKESKIKCCGKLKSNKHFTIDCGNTHKGLFMGIATLTVTIVGLLMFNEMYFNKIYVETALLEIHAWETILYIVMALCSVLCIYRMGSLKLRKVVSGIPLEHAVLLLTQCGVYLYYLFQIIGATISMRMYPESRRTIGIITSLCAVVQSSCQTLLVLNVWSRRCDPQCKTQPGRQLITFLMVGNVSIWLLNRVKNLRAVFYPLEMRIYGVWGWTLITNVSVPLLVCYRFQATVCFIEIWKNSYKKNEDVIDIEMEQINHSQQNVNNLDK